MFRYRILICLLAVQLASTYAPAETEANASLVAGPSADHGRSGKYRVEQTDGYAYWVNVPSSYSADHPAGIHLFFHGQNGQGGAEFFELWDQPFLSKYNLIGINMQYMDGDNGHDTPGKLLAAKRAVAQVIADYKILVGRGVISSFSGGGLPHSLWALGSFKTRGSDWPFCQSCLYSSNYRVNAAQGCPMSWFVSVGTDEWSLASLGIDGYHRIGELYGDIDHGGCPDVRMLILKGKGHTVDGREVAASSEEFARSDLAFAPFLYSEDYPEPELRGIVKACDDLNVGRAAALIAKMKLKPTLAPALGSKLAAIDAIVNDRLQRIAIMAPQLAADDLPLATYYLPIFQQQSKGTPVEKIVKDAIKLVSHDHLYHSTMDGYSDFLKLFPQMFVGGGSSPRPEDKDMPELNALVKKMKATSETGIMASDMLALAQ